MISFFMNYEDAGHTEQTSDEDKTKIPKEVMSPEENGVTNHQQHGANIEDKGIGLHR